jgi:hypothetical protein
MRVKPNIKHGVVKILSDLAPGDNQLAEISIAAVAEEHHVVDWVSCSYDDTPATPTVLTIALGPTGVIQHDLIGAGPFHFRYGNGKDGGLAADKNTAVTITLGAGGAGVDCNLAAGTR